MHLRSDGVLPPSSMRRVEPKRESIPGKVCKALTDHTSLFSILKTIYQWANETIRQMRPAQSFAAMNTHQDPSLNTHSTHPNNQEREEPPRLEEENMEDISIYFLRTYSSNPNWKQIVSTCNGYGQTLAHIAVTLGYVRLLQHLFRWQIDLNVVDSMGLSALHYAYLFKQEECAKILIHSGVDRSILDDLGRSPADLDPSLDVRLHSTMDIDDDSSANGTPRIECDTEMPDEAGKLYAKSFLVYGSYTPPMTTGPSSLDRTPSTSPYLPQLPTPTASISYLRNPTVKNTAGPNAQGLINYEYPGSYTPGMMMGPSALDWTPASISYLRGPTVTNIVGPNAQGLINYDYPGFYTPEMTMGPSSFDCTPSTNPNLQMPTPIASKSHLRSPSVVNTLSSNAQGPMRFLFPQSLPPDLVPLLPQQLFR